MGTATAATELYAETLDLVEALERTGYPNEKAWQLVRGLGEFEDGMDYWESIQIRVYRRKAGPPRRRRMRRPRLPGSHRGRRRRATHGWEYLGLVGIADDYIRDLVDVHGPEEAIRRTRPCDNRTEPELDTSLFIPCEYVQQRWGRGHYQFRFFRRTDWAPGPPGVTCEGKLRSLRRSHDLALGGPPVGREPCP